MITDRDIVLRAVAEGRDANTPVRDVMTERVQYCFDDESVADVARNMADLGVRRLPVVSRDQRPAGIVALSKIARCGDNRTKAAFLDGVAAPHRRRRHERRATSFTTHADRIAATSVAPTQRMTRSTP